VTEPVLNDPDTEEGAAELIRTALRETLFVEAGAGTGKTQALVQRVVSLVLDGKRIERIVAITFTEKAAAELRDRVRQGLEEALERQPNCADHVMPALESLDRAPISTIHSFCQQVLHSFSAEAGVDPSFEVQDEMASARRFQDRWRAYVEGLAGDAGAVGAVDRALGLGLTTRDLETLAWELTARAELLPLLSAGLPEAPAPGWGALPRWRLALQEIVTDGVPEGDSLRLEVEGLGRLLSELEAAGEEREAVLASSADRLVSAFGSRGSRGAWGSALTHARDVCKEVCAGLNGLLAACRAEALRDLIPIIAGFVDEDARRRGREGLMTFDDLVLRVRDLLMSHEGARHALRERYDAMLVDEFQDTDPLQVEIALAFATDPARGVIEPGRLFLVGDPKQSIYRFRRADMAIYSRTRKSVQDAGAQFPELKRNRRSRRVIISWVNRVFDHMIGKGDRPALQPPYRAIREVRGDDGLKGPGVGCFGGEVADGSNARQIRALESRDVAAYCRAAVEQGWEVRDKDHGTVRAASFRDIAVLIPARNVLASLERSLAEARVPYRVEGGSLIYRTQEVRDLINCLTAIDDPADEVAVVAALRSTAFACSDVDLACFVAGGGRFNYLRPELDGEAGPVAEGLRTLRRYHQRRHDGSLAALVEEFVTERGQVEVGILDQGDRNAFRRLRFMVEQARAFEAGGPESLRALIQWLEGRSEQVMLDYEGAGLDDDEDAVRVMTIHGAKGLEFPIVVLAGMGTTPNTRVPGCYLIDREQDRMAIAVGSKGGNRRFVLGDAGPLEQMEKEHTEAEFVRMLYVGATRARDHLLFSLYRKRGSSKAAAAQLEAAGAAEGLQPLERPSAERYHQREPFEGLIVDAPAVTDPEEFEKRRREAVAAAQARRYTSATRLGRGGEEKDAGEDDTEPWSRGRAGTRLGRAVHAAIQSLPLAPDDALIRAFSSAQAVAEAIPERADEVAQLVRAALASEAASRARAAARALREVPFAVALDGITIEGFVDLLIETQDGLEIVDWKTDHVSAAEASSRLADYRLQAGLYVLGIERATRRPVKRVTYVFVSAGREEAAGEPRELADSALARILADAGSRR